MISLSPYVFIAIYLIVDIIYVTMSKSVYNRAVRGISGADLPVTKPSFFVYAFIAYASMAIAWLVLVVPTVYYMISKGTAKWKAGLIAGLAYGLGVYGVFNGTLYTMFTEWNHAIAIRDMLWGISWATLLTTMFAITR
jgi:uncharacterized membrane protein